MAVFTAVFGLLMAALVTAQHVEIYPKEAEVKIGGDLKVMCKVTHEIDACRFRLGGTPYSLRKGVDDPHITYLGESLQAGECGAHIKNIKEEWNGNISCEVPNPSAPIEMVATMRLIVAKPPRDIILQSSTQPSFKEGEIFSAQCMVTDGRPAAKIRWFLDENEILEGLTAPQVTPGSGVDLETISQNFSRPLSADDNGRTVLCQGNHTGLNQVLEKRRQLSVHYPPKVEENAITIFGLQLNAVGWLNVTVRAEPAPTAVWQVDGETLPERTKSHDERITALAAIPFDKGYYNVTLVIAQIMKEDVDRTYHLRVSNQLGSEEITLRISTMEEPAGVELDTGAIVGILIAVLVILIAISLVVFAFATDRWCFAGRSHRTDIPDGGDSEAPLPSHEDVKGAENPSHDHGDYISNGRRRDNTKSSGESSDTESAVGGKERSRLAQLSARVRAALPRAKDKVQATETVPQEDDEKPAEDKVVYATLALSEQTPADKPPPAFAEYAEIVYTDQGQKDVKETV